MCIIQGLVKEVSKTKIMVAPLAHHRQLTVYANKVSMGNTQYRAMILPFPCSKGEFFDLSVYPELFDDLNMMCWPQVKSNSYSYSDGAQASCNNSLAVVQVGSYHASIVPTLSDFSRINTQVFSLDTKVKDFLQTYYPTGYSFMVCQLDENKEYHPFGYIHDTLPSGQLFIPTMHYHQHQKNIQTDKPFLTPKDNDNLPLTPENDLNFNSVDWDHEIYLWNRPLQITPGEFYSNKVKVRIDMIKIFLLPSELEAEDQVYAYRVKPNYHQNHDLLSV